jgi:hypothetical protein
MLKTINHILRRKILQILEEKYELRQKLQQI